MIIKRFISYLGLALAACLFSSAAMAVEQVTYLARTAADYNSYSTYGAHAAKHDLTLTQWRHGSQEQVESPASNLISLSNHFGMASAAPFGDERPDTITV